MKIIRLSPDDKLNPEDFPEVDISTWDENVWHKEHPMDYIKAIKIMNMCPPELRGEVFKIIFKVTRRHLPDILYKYYSLSDDNALNEIKLFTLAKKTIFLTELSNFNDPYDDRALLYNPVELTGYKGLNRFEGRLIDDFGEYHIGSSFTEAGYLNMPLWAHYANNHKGYCVSYKSTDNKMIESFAFPIQYSDSRFDITDYLIRFLDYAAIEEQKQQENGSKEILLKDMTVVLVILLLNFIKSSDWTYEQEYRISLPKTHPSRYIEMIPHEIYIGTSCNSEYRNKLLQIGKEQNIAVYQITQDNANEGFSVKPVLLKM